MACLMALACVAEGGGGKRVSFGGCVIYEVEAEGTLERDCRRKPADPSYRHPSEQRRKDKNPESELAAAIKRAQVLAAEVEESLAEVMAAPVRHSAAWGPSQWIIDTGSAFDLIAETMSPLLCLTEWWTRYVPMSSLLPTGESWLTRRSPSRSVLWVRWSNRC